MGTFLSRYYLRAGNSKKIEDARKALGDALKETDLRVEEELLQFALGE